VVEWSEEKGCGFIRPRGAKETDPQVFVGMASMATRKKKPQVGDVLLYEMVEVPNTGKNRRLRTPYRAENATFLGEEVPQAPDRRGEMMAVALGVAYLVALGLVSLVQPLARIVLAIDVAAGVIAFILYWYDKNCAEAGRFRVTEAALQGWALVGGWPGAAVAQRVFRHKTRKGSYQNVFRLVIFLNILLTACILFFAMASRPL
jgi:uncharacterized membrane protein YsdA (DUF1294 family)/cold shock CspA family protein